MREKVEASGLQRAFIIWGYELTGRKWEDKVSLIVQLAQLRGHEIVFIDNTSRSAGIQDEGGVEFARAVEFLQEACRNAGLTLTIDVHHKKGRDSIENKTRGGTGVQGAVDINLEIERVGGTRKRKLTAFGRVRATHWVKTIELSEDGHEYELVDAEDADEVDADTQKRFHDAEALRRLGGPVTWQSFAAEVDVKTASTARNRLNTLVDEGLAVKHKGSGPDPDRWEATAVKGVGRNGRPAALHTPASLVVRAKTGFPGTAQAHDLLSREIDES